MPKRWAAPLMLIAGLLFVFAGVRDIFWPGFLSMSSRHSSGNASIAVGVVFLILAARQAQRPAA